MIIAAIWIGCFALALSFKVLLDVLVYVLRVVLTITNSKMNTDSYTYKIWVLNWVVWFFVAVTLTLLHLA